MQLVLLYVVLTLLGFAAAATANPSGECEGTANPIPAISWILYLLGLLVGFAGIVSGASWNDSHPGARRGTTPEIVALILAVVLPPLALGSACL